MTSLKPGYKAVTSCEDLREGKSLDASAFPRCRAEVHKRRDTRFWPLGQALSALDPPGTEEKRWGMAYSPARRSSGADWDGFAVGKHGIVRTKEEWS
jgi:hypothetical protein